MRSRHLLWLTCCILFTDFSFAATDTIFKQSSPDRELNVYLRLQDHSSLQYRVEYKGVKVMEWSPLGLTLADRNIPAKNTRILGIHKTVVDETFPWLFGENATIRNNYRQLVMECKQDDAISFNIAVRVFNNNIAFRYEIPSQKTLPSFEIIKENTGFTFLRPFTVYRHEKESVFSPAHIRDLQLNSDFPVVCSSRDLVMSINEAKNDHYTKAVIGKGDIDNSLQVQFVKDTVRIKGAFQSPWRTITFAESDIALCDNSDLLYKLNDRLPPGDYSWIKPGKLIRDMTLTTKGALDCIDFAQKMNFQYILFDAGWYGKGYYAEFDRTSDPHNTVNEIDMPKVIAYGRQKNIGLILYVNYVGLRKNNMDSLFTLYKNWGIKGLKFGFVNGLTQDGITWLMGAVKKAQDHKLIIDVHDNYKPTGISRTIPAWLTQEGVRGNENNPDAFHNTTLPFTRFLSGPADYTFCYRNQNDSFNNTLLSKKLQVSKAQQLALTVIYYSPLQSMLWYGRPADYTVPEEIEFFRYVPTTWDKTIHLEGEIGRFAAVARKKGDTWFIGVATNEERYRSVISLDFLEHNKKYLATIYEDDGRGGITKRRKKVNSRTLLTLHIAEKCGVAIMVSGK